MIFYKLYVHLINKKNSSQSSGSCFSENSTQLMCSLIFFVDKYLITLISTINIMNLYFIKVRLNQNECMKSSISKNWPEKFEGFLPCEFLYSNFWKIGDFINTFWLNLTFSNVYLNLLLCKGCFLAGKTENLMHKVRLHTWYLLSSDMHELIFIIVICIFYVIVKCILYIS